MLQRKTLKLRIKEILHSIPISNFRNKQLGLDKRSILCNNLRCVSSGIPLASICALLLMSLVLVNPVVSESFALENGSDSIADANDERLKSETTPEKLDNVDAESETEEVNPEKTENLSDGDLALPEPDPSAILSSKNGVMTLTDSNSNAILTISGNLNEVTNAAPGEISYRSHNVTVNLQDVSSYMLQISYANGTGDALKYDGVGSANSVISGAGGKTPTNMAANSWGYAWSDSTTAADSGLTYQNVPNYSATSGKNLKVETTTGSSTITKNFSGKLTFAAKFATNAPLGHYKTQVLLSLSATPRGVVSWNSLTQMQEMTSTACAEAPYKTEKTLMDTRDSSTYTIMKLDDGNCWMTQNLRIVGGEITSHDSDITVASYTVPASSVISSSDKWGEDNTIAKIYYANNTVYGAYYSWCAVTAESCNAAIDDGAVATSSVCPRGWKLPEKTEYDALIKKGNSWDSANKGKTIGGGLFPAAGFISGSSSQSVGSSGYFWSSTAQNGTNAYELTFYNYGCGVDSPSRYRGHSVRCIAK